MNNTVKVESRDRMLSKAKICGVDDSGSPGKDAFYVQFNPNEISISEACASLYETKNNDLKVNPVENTSSQHVLHLSTTLFYNTYTNLSATTYIDVRDYIRQLYPYTNASIKNKDNLKKIAFMWGSISVIGVLEKMDVRYTMFSPDGTPIRGEVSISIAGNYYGESSKTISTEASAEISEHTSITDMLRTFQESDDWKNLARKQGVVNPRKEAKQ